MEDRLTQALYLEMTELTPDAYAAARVPGVLTLPGVERATWWENVKRDRDDLPRVLPEFALLGVYEVDETFVAPDAQEGINALHFRRTPRPGQGSLSAAKTIGLSLVLISTKPIEASASPA